MTKREEAKEELKARRASLRQMYQTAKRKGDQAEMDRLVVLAGEIDDKMDDLVFEEIENIANILEEISSKVKNAHDRINGNAPPLSQTPSGTSSSSPPISSGGHATSLSQVSWNELVSTYRVTEIEFPNLKAVTLAQWMLESGRGTSNLAINHNNYAGMKWRTPMAPYGKRVSYKAHDGSGYYTHFHDLDAFISGFWVFLDTHPYNGWRERAGSPEEFIEFIGPIWAEDAAYVDKVLNLLMEAEGLLGIHSHTADINEGIGAQDDGASGGVLIPGRPSLLLDPTRKVVSGTEDLEIAYFGSDSCPYGKTASANKQPFSGMVIHHTQDRHDAEWYVDYQIRGDSARGGHFGYHFYIEKNGTILQGAPMTKRTNHISPRSSVRRAIGSNLQNTNTIGISCVGAWISGDFNPTAKQKSSVEELVFALADLYSIPFANVFGHGEIQTNRPKVEGTSLALKIRRW